MSYNVRRFPSNEFSYTCGWKVRLFGKEYHITMTRLGHAEWFDKEEFISKVMRNLKKETRFTISDFEDFNNNTPVILVNLESNIIQEYVDSLHNEYGNMERTGYFYNSGTPDRKLHVTFRGDFKTRNKVKKEWILSASEFFIKREGNFDPIFTMKLPCRFRN